MKPDKKFLINLAAFLVRAKKETYASGGLAKKIHEADGSISLIYEEINWKYHDNYHGGEPFGGREVVFYKGKAVFFMCYYGRVFESFNDLEIFYKFLQNALSKVTEEKPFRGPTFFYSDEMKEVLRTDESSPEIRLSYFSNTNGDIKNFSGFDFVTQDNEKIYEATFSGGLINLR